MSKKAFLVFHCAYQSDLSVLGTRVAFAQDRGAKVLKKLREEFAGTIDEVLVKPRPATFKQLELAHSQAHLEGLKEPESWRKIFGTDKPLERNKENLNTLRKLFREYRLKTGGTITAARLALKHGLAANLGAGYHHAYRDRGDGFCIINDIATTVKVLQSEGRVKTVLIIDLDFHQGNGTSNIFAGDKSVFTLDVHSKEGWPFHKEKSSLDVPVKKDITPQAYLDALKQALTKALAKFKPDLVLFIQGADAYEYGQLNKGEGFSLPLATMKERDELVIDTFVELNIPLALIFAGGYGDRAWEAHHQGVRHLLSRTGILSDSSNAG